MTVHAVVSILLALFVSQAPQVPAPKTTGATPSACLTEVRDYVAKRNAALPPLDTSKMTTDEIRAMTQTQAWKDRIAVSSEISRHRVAMLRECLAKFDTAAVGDGDVTALIELHTEAGSAPELVAPLVTRALALKTLPENQHAVILVSAVRTGLREPKGEV